MKKYIPLLVLVFLASCSPRGIFFGTDADRNPLSPALYVYREAPIHGAALREKRLNKPVLEQFADGHEPGADPVSIDVSGWTAEELVAAMKEGGGNYFSGRIRTVRWKYRGLDRIHVSAENIYWDRQYEVFVHGWQGFTHDAGYSSSDWDETVEGPEPLIQGVNYNH